MTKSRSAPPVAEIGFFFDSRDAAGTFITTASLPRVRCNANDDRTHERRKKSYVTRFYVTRSIARLLSDRNALS